MSEEYYLKIHGHSCLELKAQNTAILFDPWLNGSAYWRSWWNFPEPESLDEIIKSLSKCNQIYIYNSFTLGSFSWAYIEKNI